MTGDPDDEDDETDDGRPGVAPAPAPGAKLYMTPQGHRALAEELEHLRRVERPKTVEIVAWAASLGDRSENADYLYGKRRLREIDRRIRFLVKRLDAAEVVDPRRQQGLDRVFFGAEVLYANGRDEQIRVRIVGVDEADLAKGTISWLSPVAQALRGKRVGDEASVRTPGGQDTLEVIEIRYPVD